MEEMDDKEKKGRRKGGGGEGVGRRKTVDVK
jgi:hypothetical protein